MGDDFVTDVLRANTTASAGEEPKTADAECNSSNDTLCFLLLARLDNRLSKDLVEACPQS